MRCVASFSHYIPLILLSSIRTLMSHKHIQYLLVPLSCLILLLFQLILAFKLPTLNCVEIEKEIIANNGIIYQLRWPLTTSAQTVLELLSADEQFSSFVECNFHLAIFRSNNILVVLHYLKKNSSLVLDKQSIKLLNSTDAVTVFAFTNSIFSSLSPSLQSKMRRGCAKGYFLDNRFTNYIINWKGQSNAWFSLIYIENQRFDSRRINFY